MHQETLRETALMSVGPEGPGKGIWKALLIAADVQGSSGYYPAEVLRRDGAKAFPAGTHIYFDHPSNAEENERPERSVRDIAGYLLDDASFEETPEGSGLYSRIQFTEKARGLAHELKSVIGLSIRAAGRIEENREGQRIVRSIDHGLSVDLVTRAGAGGRLVAMIESAKPESPPAEQTETGADTTATGSISSTTGTGTLLSEVASLKETLGDRVEQLSIDVARMAQQLKESQRKSEEQAKENAKLSEAILFLRDRAEATEQRMSEAKGISSVVSDLMEASRDLPLPSLLRLAQAYQPGQDLPGAINAEREYVRKVKRETERNSLGLTESRDPSPLGVTESTSSVFSSSSDSDLAEIRSLLAGGSF